MAERSIPQNRGKLNSNQLGDVLVLLSNIESILMLTQANLYSQPRLVIYDALCVISYLVSDIKAFYESEP